MEILLTRYHWLKLSSDQRRIMRTAFNIPKSGGVEMQDNKMLSDGSNENDLKAVNVATMQSFTESDEKDFFKLYDLTIAKIDELIDEEKEEYQAGLKKENSKKRMQEIGEVVDTLLETITNLPIDAQVQIKKALASIGTNEETDVKQTKGRKKA